MKYSYYETVKKDVESRLLDMFEECPHEELTAPNSNAELKAYIKDMLMDDPCVVDSTLYHDYSFYDYLTISEMVNDNWNLALMSFDFFNIKKEDYFSHDTYDYIMIDRNIRQYVMCQVVDRIVDLWEKVSIERFWECL